MKKINDLFNVLKVENLNNNDYLVVWTSKNRKYNISIAENKNFKNKYFIKVDDCWLSDFPIMYENYNYCVYDYPERFPNYVKDKVNVIARKMRKYDLF